MNDTAVGDAAGSSPVVNSVSGMVETEPPIRLFGAPVAARRKAKRVLIGQDEGRIYYRF